MVRQISLCCCGKRLSGRRPAKVDAAMLAKADLVISMGCDDPAVCEYPGRKVEDWGIEDPSGKPVEDVRRIRDLLRDRVMQLVRRLESSSPSTNLRS